MNCADAACIAPIEIGHSFNAPFQCFVTRKWQGAVEFHQIAHGAFALLAFWIISSRNEDWRTAQAIMIVAFDVALIIPYRTLAGKFNLRRANEWNRIAGFLFLLCPIVIQQCDAAIGRVFLVRNTWVQNNVVQIASKNQTV